jgi:hypothetical protein
MGEALTFMSRKASSMDEFLKDPNNAHKRSAAKKPGTESSSAIDPATLATLMEQTIHRNYANWADEKLRSWTIKLPDK